MEKDELITYFETKELPPTIKTKSGTITDVPAFVATNILRLKEGAPAIRKASEWLLQELHEILEKK
jgi:hypothetical protein